MPDVRHPVEVRAEGWGWRHAGRGSFAVRGLDLVIAPGERVLLLGASGAGKSTLMAAMAGVLGGDGEGDTEGRLSVDGVPPASRRGVAGLVMQDPDSQVVLARVGDDVAFGPENLAVPREEIWQRVRRSLDAVGLDVALDRSTEKLSGGQRQRLALAGVLAMEPGLLLLDEPTANLDPAGVAEVAAAVARVVAERSMTLVVIEHRVDVWADVVDRVVVLAPGGGVLAEGAPDVVFETHRDELAAAGVWVPGLPEPDPLPRPSVLPEPILSATGLTIGHESAHPVRRLDVAIPRGVSTCLVGPNGAGKSTLALTLAGLLAEIDGEVVAAADLVPARRRPRPFTWRSRELLTRIGTVFQDPEHQFVATTVRAELAVGLQALKLPQATIDARVDELLARLRLDRLAQANPFTLSGGEKRRLSVATMLATQPQVLFLDEPTFGQDRVTWGEIVALVRSLREEGRTLISITHDPAYVAALGEHVLDLGAA